MEIIYKTHLRIKIVKFNEMYVLLNKGHENDPIKPG